MPRHSPGSVQQVGPPLEHTPHLGRAHPGAPGACLRRAASAAAARREPESGARGATLCTAARPTLPLPSATLSSVVLAAQLISHGQRRRHETHQERAPGPREGPPIHLQRRPTRRRSLPLAVYDHGTGACVCRCGRPPPLPFRPFPTCTRPPHHTPRWHATGQGSSFCATP